VSARSLRVLQRIQRSTRRIHMTGESVLRADGVIDRATIRDYYSPLQFVQRWGVWS
jgi:hypothetical protein